MEDNRLILSNLSDHWYLVGILFIIVLVIIYLDIYYRNKRRRQWRLISYFILVAALSGMIFKPQYKKPIAGDHITILTRGYDQDILDSLSVDKEIKVYTKQYHNSLLTHSNKILDAYDLIYQNDNIQNIEILGEGLNDYELETLKDYNVNFYPGKDYQGIIDIRFDKSVELEKLINIEGTINRNQGTKLVLTNGDLKIDSIELVNESHFYLSIKPKVIGRFIYSLKEYLGDSLIEDYPLPVEVLPKRQLKVLFINDYPIFDTKYLRNYLAKQGHKVIVRNRYSREKFNYGYYNTNEKSVVDLASDKLKEVDLLLIDYQSLFSLSNREMNNLNKMVRDFGLSIFLQNVYEKPSLSTIKLFDGLSIKESKKEEFLVKEGISITNNKFSLSNQFISIDSKQSLNSLGGYKLFGIGKVGVLSFQNSYELVLKGHQELYGSIWKDVLEQVIKRRENKFSFKFVDEFPVINSPLDVLFENNTQEKYQVSIDSFMLPIKQDLQLTNRWTSKYWANEIGWHTLSIKETTYSSFQYVYDESDWRDLKSYRKTTKNKLFAQRDKIKSNTFTNYTYEEVSPIVFYILFLVGFAYLWIETKL